jgi:hypothetical protein
MSSFTSDERGVTEPYTDLPALGLVTIGLLLFGYLLFAAFSAYAEKTYYADVREDLRTMAVAIAGDPSIACDGSSFVLDAGKLANASARPDALLRYGRPGETVAAEVDAGNYAWHVGAGGGRSASYRLPVSVRLNDARCLSGTLTVTSSEGAA